MASKTVLIRVPATVGNFAGAMNCAALALDAPLNVKVTLRFDGRVSLRYFGEHGERVPRDRSNLVVQSLEAALRSKGLEFPGADFEIYSSVPVAVGLGSSAAAVLAGLIAGDRLYRLGLDERALFDLAGNLESRPENIRAAWFGGLVSATDEAAVGGSKRFEFPEKFVLNVVVPQFNQPDTGFAPSGVREVPGLEEALKVRMPGVTIFRCGSGPGVGIVDEEMTPEAIKAVQDCFARRGIESRPRRFHPSNAGAQEWNALQTEVSLPRGQALAPPVKKISLIPV